MSTRRGKKRMVRGGSLWTSRSGRTVRVIWQHREIVAFVDRVGGKTGGVMPEDEFRQMFEWTAGR